MKRAWTIVAATLTLAGCGSDDTTTEQTPYSSGLLREELQEAFDASEAFASVYTECLEEAKCARQERLDAAAQINGARDATTELEETASDPGCASGARQIGTGLTLLDGAMREMEDTAGDPDGVESAISRRERAMQELAGALRALNDGCA